MIEMRLCALIGLIALTLLMSTRESWSGESEQQRRTRQIFDSIERPTLAGVKAVYVLVEELHQDLEESGLSTAKVQTDAELRLRSAGVRVATASERSALPGGPFLYVVVEFYRLPNIFGDKVGYYGTITISFMQNVQLERNASISTIAPTWSKAQYGVMATRLTENAIRKTVRDLTDEFANAYLSVNPK